MDYKSQIMRVIINHPAQLAHTLKSIAAESTQAPQHIAYMRCSRLASFAVRSQ
ncbi:hypothetical protein LPST10_00048 [Salmonella phage LPST10]|uniref:Uncharacterized protein n=1 Tax=Salmonella phage LPST10 TaxID=1973454 RepID=A0A1W6DXP8_9CAUD|nr:hypothetical protein KGB45_gp48 [Salmonella phage LPST10]ARK07780.1 hypothetical protein LPST10_00048 [Salmonella phage LPST10]